MNVIHGPLSESDLTLPIVWLPVGRRSLAKRVWRARAEDGRELAFYLSETLQHEATVLQEAGKRYVIRQEPESLLEIALPADPPAAARLGWILGNLHLSCQIGRSWVRVPESPEAQVALQKLGHSYHSVEAVFQPDSPAATPHAHGPGC